MIEFFGDENFSPRILRILDEYDTSNKVSWLPNFLKNNDFGNEGRAVSDIVWLEFMASVKPDCVIISNDDRIPRNPSERQTLIESNLMFIALSNQWGHFDLENQVVHIIRAWKYILSEIKNAKEPSLIYIKFKKGHNRPVIENHGKTRNLKL